MLRLRLSTGNNIVGDATGCTFGTQSTDRVGSGASPVDPRLGPLADNGGPTMTHALLDGSPAIDAADQAAAPPVDQRGAPRNPDIGAYERVFCLDVPVNVVGTEGDDILGGTAGPDSVLALGGNDEIAIGEGDDTVCAGGGNDRVQAEGGKDGVLAGSGKDIAAGGGGKDKLWGEGQKDTLRGQGGKDTLRGGGGKDKLVGGGGADILKGQAGKDTSNGGGGRDTCRAPAKEVNCER